MPSTPSTTERLAGPLAGLDRALQWGVRLVWLNLWWLLFTLAGGVVLGFGPATVAAYGIARRWVHGDSDQSVPRTMGRLWRQHWRRSVTASLVTAAVLASLVATLWLARTQPPIPRAATQGVVIILLITLAVIVAHLAWLVERDGERDLARLFLTALAVGLGRPVLTLVILGVTVGWPALLVGLGWPGLLPVCAAAVPIAASAWCVERTFPAQQEDPGDQHLSTTTTSDTSVS